MTDDYEWSDEAVEAFKDAHDKIWYNDGSWSDKNAAVRYGLTAAAKVQGLVPAAAAAQQPTEPKIIQLVFAPDGPVNHASLYALWSDGAVTFRTVSEHAPEWTELTGLKMRPPQQS
jgi:hypothetical protein